MSPETQITLRLPKAFLSRADKLISRVDRDPQLSTMAWGGTIRRSQVLRLALLRGLDALEDEYSKKNK